MARTAVSKQTDQIQERGRAAALRVDLEERTSEPTVEHKPETRVESASSAPRPPAWECKFCGRGFHSYGTYLNHRCHDELEG